MQASEVGRRSQAMQQAMDEILSGRNADANALALEISAKCRRRSARRCFIGRSWRR
jgi:hypothetical protein